MRGISKEKEHSEEWMRELLGSVKIKNKLGKKQRAILDEVAGYRFQKKGDAE